MRINNLVKILQSITNDIKLSFGLSYEGISERYLNSPHAIILNWNSVNAFEKYLNGSEFEYSYSLFYKFPKKGNVLEKIETLIDLLLDNNKFLDNGDLYRSVDFDTVIPIEDSELYIVVQIDLIIR